MISEDKTCYCVIFKCGSAWFGNSNIFTMILFTIGVFFIIQDVIRSIYTAIGKLVFDMAVTHGL